MITQPWGWKPSAAISLAMRVQRSVSTPSLAILTASGTPPRALTLFLATLLEPTTRPSGFRRSITTPDLRETVEAATTQPSAAQRSLTTPAAPTLALVLTLESI